MVKEIKLEGRLDLDAATKLLDSLKEAKGEPVDLDASDVSLLGGPCLEVLLSAAAHWRASDHEFSIRNPSTAFQENLIMLGVAPDDVSVVEA